MTIRIIDVDDQLLRDAQVRLRQSSIRETIEIALRVLAATPTQSLKPATSREPEAAAPGRPGRLPASRSWP
jgi:Arc/MetJ family transcription regulator